MKFSFKFPMTKKERITGMIYIPFHALLLPVLIELVYVLFGLEVSSPYRMLVYYTVSFVIIVALMFRFLRASFSDLIDEFWRAIQAIILGYILFRVLLWVFVLLMAQIMAEANPNSDAIIGDITANFRVMLIVTTVLAPIVEETIFRGALFGTIRQKNRIAAYVVSVLLFGLFHVWDHILFDFSQTALLLIIQYIPPSIALAWCYDRSGTIWAPIILHGWINLMTTLQLR